MVGLLFIALALGAAATSATIYKCPGSDGETLFSDHPCAGGHAQKTQPVITVDMSHFSADERETLERLRHADASPPEEMPRANASANANANARHEGCEAARDALDRVRATRRRGYRASSAAALDARERRYEEQRDRNCH